MNALVSTVAYIMHMHVRLMIVETTSTTPKDERRASAKKPVRTIRFDAKPMPKHTALIFLRLCIVSPSFFLILINFGDMCKLVHMKCRVYQCIFWGDGELAEGFEGSPSTITHDGVGSKIESLTHRASFDCLAIND